MNVVIAMSERVEEAIGKVTYREYQRPTPAQQEDEAVVDAIHALDFITDGITGQPLLPLHARRERRDRAFDPMFAVIGITIDPA